jgi:hypothetical protein
MHCRHCGARTRVVVTEHRADGTHRWLRCLVCERSLRTRETFFNPMKSTYRASGSRNGASVLTEADVVRLRNLAASGIPQKNLAKEYGIAVGTVSRIVTRKLWSHI